VKARLDTVLIKAASRCDLDCTYCYVYQGKDTSWKQQPKRMSEKTINVLVNRLVEQSKYQDVGFAIVLHGGEPLLLGYEKLSLLIKLLRSKLDSQLYPISLQTNGGLLTNELLNLFSENKVSVSVSIDGDKNANDIARITRKGLSSFYKTLKGIELLKNHSDRDFLFAGTLSVIQPSIPPAETYNFLKSLGTPSMDFLFQDGNHNQLPVGKKTFESTEYGSWLSTLLEIYLADKEPIKIPCIDDVLRLSLGGHSSKEGKGQESFGILIIETDGEIRKNDTLRLSYDGADFFNIREYIKDIPLSKVLESHEFKVVSDLQSTISSTCLDCPIVDVCGGGMPLYRWDAKNGYDNPSVYCRDHYLFIKKAQEFIMVGI